MFTCHYAETPLFYQDGNGRIGPGSAHLRIGQARQQAAFAKSPVVIEVSNFGTNSIPVSCFFVCPRDQAVLGLVTRFFDVLGSFMKAVILLPFRQNLLP